MNNKVTTALYVSLTSISCLILYEISLSINPYLNFRHNKDNSIDIKVTNIQGIMKRSGNILDLKYNNLECLKNKSWVINKRVDSSLFSSNHGPCLTFNLNRELNKYEDVRDTFIKDCDECKFNLELAYKDHFGIKINRSLI